MISRRKLITSSILFSTGVAAGYLLNDPLLSRLFSIYKDEVDQPPPPGLVGLEFENGEVEKIDNLIISKSEFEWMKQHHSKVRDPYEVTRLLAGHYYLPADRD